MTVIELPLSNWRVLVTRPAEQARHLLEALEAAGATAIPYPTIGVEEPPTWTPFDSAVARLDSFDWIVFASPSAVSFALGRAPNLPGRLCSVRAPAVAAVGAETAKALQERGVPVAVVPDDQRQEGLVAALGQLPAGTRVLFPQALGGRELLHDELVRLGSEVDVVPVSRTVHLPMTEPPPDFDAATFASPSALQAFLTRMTTAALRDKVVAVIGPTTRDAALASGLTVQVVAARPSVTSLVSALCDYRGRG